MSEYQRYEFMTVDQPLTAAQLRAVKDLSSHIEASSTHAVIEYHWGDFKHDPIKVLHKFFDGFLYWANWGSPRLALRFPHGVLPANLIDDYDLDEFATFTKHQDYDILDIHFGEMESSGEWIEYDLGSLIPVRDELMEGDPRVLYIVWLACQSMLGDYDEEEEEDEREDEEKEGDGEGRDYRPKVPSAFGKLTAGQKALAEFLRVPDDLLAAAAQHSAKTAISTKNDDFAAWIKLLPPERRDDYLVRLAHNELGLSHLLVKELRQLGQGQTKAAPAQGEYVSYSTLLTESKSIEARRGREMLEQEERAHQQRLQDIHTHRQTYWRQVEQSALRATSAGYDDALQLLTELRDAAERFDTMDEFQARYRTWVRPYLRRSALIKRLQLHRFTIPSA